MTSVQSFDESLKADPAPRIPAAAADGSRGLTVIYSLTIFLSAFLLFQVQPLIGKFILPWFGGMPSVWTTCMLFFQLLLFGGYAYAHLTTSSLRPRWQAIVHVVLLAAACLACSRLASACGRPGGTSMPVVPSMIASSPDVVWAVLTDGASWPSWDSGVDRVEGQIAPGQKITIR